MRPFSVPNSPQNAEKIEKYESGVKPISILLINASLLSLLLHFGTEQSVNRLHAVPTTCTVSTKVIKKSQNVCSLWECFRNMFNLSQQPFIANVC